MRWPKVILICTAICVILVIAIWALAVSIMWRTVRYVDQQPYPDGFKPEHIQSYPDLSHCDLLVKVELRYEVDYLSEVRGSAQLRAGLYTANPSLVGQDNLIESIELFDDTNNLIRRWDNPSLTSPISEREPYIYGEFASDYELDLGEDMSHIMVIVNFADHPHCPPDSLQFQLDRVIERGFFRFTT